MVSPHLADAVTDADAQNAADLRALNLFERLLGYPGNERFRARLLRREPNAVLARLSQLEAGHRARAAMPTELPDWGAVALVKPPGRIGPFRLVKRIGQGGMGDVWLGERDDGLFEQVVAIKLINASLDARAAEAFAAERRILAKLDHPDIVRLIDGGVTEDALPYLVMDYVEGVPFDVAVAPLPFDQRIRLFIQAARVVQFAHGKLVAHADLKPSNILVDTAGRVRLLDFGISEMLAVDRPKLRTRGAMTIAFASPQRIAGEAPSIADDVYALGKLLSLIIGESSDRDLSAIIARATAMHEAARYATMAGLIADLQFWQQTMPVSARVPTWRYVSGKFLARNRRAVVAASLGLLALVATTIYATAASIEASARFDDARGIARYLLFTLLDRLEAKPNTLALRTEVAGVAQHYLDRLANTRNATPEVRRETARGYIRLAEAQGVPGHQNLDQGALAQQNLERGIGLLGNPSDDASAQIAILALIGDMRLSSYVNNNPDAALRLLARAEVIASAHPSLPKLFRARLLIERADAASWKGQFPSAITAAQAALAMLGSDDGVDAISARGNALELIAQGRGSLGQMTQSLAAYRQEVALYEFGVRQHPDSRRLRLNVARARWQLGASDMDHPTARALAQLTKASAELHAIAAFDTDDANALRLASYADADRAHMLAKRGQLAAGLKIIRVSLVHEAEQAEAHPQEPQWRRDYIIDQSLLGDLLTEGGQRQAGCRAFATFRAEVSALSQQNKLTDLALGDALSDVGKHEAKYCPRATTQK